MPTTTRKNISQQQVVARTSALVACAVHRLTLLDQRPSPKGVEGWLNGLNLDSASIFSEARDSLLQQAGLVDELLATLSAQKQPIADFLGQCLLRESSDSAKRRGAIFTPTWLASRVANNCIAHWKRLHRTGKPPRKVADLSCGVGAFLQAITPLLEHGASLIGVDSHPTSVDYARLLMAACDSDWQLDCHDTLLAAPFIGSLFPEDIQVDNDDFDILIGNPPFVRSPLLDKQYSNQIRSHYSAVDSGNYDLSVAFIEHAIRALSDGGLASYVLTHKFMTSSYGARICKMLSQKARVINIEDFHDYQVFAGYTTYTCVLTFARNTPAKYFTVTRFPQGVNGKHDPGRGTTESLESSRLDHHPWDFATDTTHSILRLLRDERHPLVTEAIGDILQGMRTGANNAFVIKQEQAGELEPAILRPFVSGEHIRRGVATTSALQLLFPYEADAFGAYRLIDEKKMESQFPAAWAHLKSHRQSLAERAVDESSPWYAFSRSQNLDLASKRKLLIKEMMPRAEFAADKNGEIAFCSGYAVDASRLDEETLDLWTAVLCTPTLEFSLRHTGTQLQSGWFRLLKHHLRRLRLPTFSKGQVSHAKKKAAAFLSNPESQELLDSLDQVVAKAFGLDDSHRKHIRDFLSEFHRRSLPKNRSRQTSTSTRYEPVKLEEFSALHRDRHDLQKLVTFTKNKDQPVHNWFKYTQGFSASLITTLIDELGLKEPILDPFAGCGTTLLECRRRRVASVGIEISPFMTWIADVKTTAWTPRECETLLSSLKKPRVAEAKWEGALQVFQDYLQKAYSDDVLNQIASYALAFTSKKFKPRQRKFLLTALLGIMEEVSQIRKHGSHYRYMLRTESVGLQKLNTQIFPSDGDIWEIYKARLASMVSDVRQCPLPRPLSSLAIHCEDARKSSIADESIGSVVTSPPYLNRNNYIAQQKAELAILGLVKSRNEYQDLVRSTLRSHVECKFEKDPQTSIPEVTTILDALALTEKNNAKIPHMIAGYFEDLKACVTDLFRVLKPGATAAFVVGNTRWGGVVVPVDHMLMKIAERIGFSPRSIYVTRLKGNSPQQMKQFGRIPVRESIVVFSK